MKNKLRLLITLLTLSLSIVGIAQTDQVARVELSLDEEWDDFFVVPMKDKGIMLGSFGDRERIY